MNLQISESTAFVGEIAVLSTLECEYAGDDVYRQKILDLSGKYKNMRRTRPDGNCFYRAFSYAYLERLLDKPEEYLAFRELAANSKADLVAIGFPLFTVEDFHDTVYHTFVHIKYKFKCICGFIIRTSLYC